MFIAIIKKEFLCYSYRDSKVQIGISFDIVGNGDNEVDMIISMIAMIMRSSSYPVFIQKYNLAMGIEKFGG